LAFAHLALAAVWAIFRRFAGDKFSILALADLRPIWAKYADSFLSITRHHIMRSGLALNQLPQQLHQDVGSSISPNRRSSGTSIPIRKDRRSVV
jgi:hypothetical protein